MQLPHVHDSPYSLLRPRWRGGGGADLVPGRRPPRWYIKRCIISLVSNTVLKLSAHSLQTPEDKARKGKGWSWGPSLGPDSCLFITPTLRELQGKPRSFPGLATRGCSGEGTHSHPFRLVTGKFQILAQVPDGQLSAGTVTLGPQLAFLLACERAACCQARARASSRPHPRGAHRDSVLATGQDGCQTGGRAQGEIPESVPISTRAGVRPSAVKL